MEGWIKLHRKLQEHWLWSNGSYFKWWIIILLNVNYKESKFPINFKIHTCKPGQSYRSLDQWAKLFGCSKKTVVKFFDLLKKDGMINTEILGKGNQRKHLLTVNKWKEYQSEETEQCPPGKPDNAHRMPPNKKEEERKKDKEVRERSQKFYLEIAEYSKKYSKETLRAFYDYWSEPNKSKTKMRFEMEKTWETSRRLSKWKSNENKFNGKYSGQKETYDATEQYKKF